MGKLRIITNHIPRSLVSDYELTPEERKEFNYLDWGAIDNGEDSASFVRYKGELIDIGTFERRTGLGGNWHGIRRDSFFSGVVIRLSDDGETAILGLALLDD